MVVICPMRQVWFSDRWTTTRWTTGSSCSAGTGSPSFVIPRSDWSVHRLSTTAECIKSFQDNAAEVVLVRCTDQSDLGMTKDGLPVSAVRDEPVVQRVVRRSENHTWRIGQITTTDKSCGRRTQEHRPRPRRR